MVFGDVVLDRSCLFAHRNGKQIRFTRSERSLLLALSRNPHRLMRRSQLLDVVASADSDTSDRNVDFLINRLRSKLGDSARAPKYIATQYGEGYVWIATQLLTAPPRPGLVSTLRLLAIVTICGRQDKELAKHADVIAGQMRDAIAGQVGAGQSVIVAESEEGAGAQYVLQVSLRDSGLRLDCTATLREMSSRRIIQAARLELAGVGVEPSLEIERTSNGIVEALQRNLAAASEGLGTPTDQPIEVRFRKATTLLSASNPQWLEKGLQLRDAREQDPASPDIALQWGLHLFARLVLANPFTGISHGERDDLEREIEATVLECLPLIESNPLLMLAAAK
ncbi:MAG: hypothetical protein B7Y77_02945, partial [Bradyrhizobium sp. 35-63-5]